MTLVKESSSLPLIDRQKTCPFLLRIFLCKGRHFPMSEYTNHRSPSKDNELQIYTWLDATLSELMGLIREIPGHRDKGLTVGGKRSSDDDLTLAQCRYQIGDFLDVAILPAGSDASQATRVGAQPSKRNRHRNRGGSDRARLNR